MGASGWAGKSVRGTIGGLAVSFGGVAEAQPTFQPVALSGQPAAGANSNYASFSVAGVTPGGQVNYTATLDGAAASNRGIFVGPASGPSLRLRTGDVAPGTGGAAFAIFERAAVTDAGLLSVFGAVAGGGFDKHGIWTTAGGGGGGLGLVARTNAASPFGAGVNYRANGPFTFQLASATGADQALFPVQLAGAGVTFDNDEGIVLQKGGSTVAVARKGSPAAGTARNFAGPFFAPVMNAGGDVAFHAGLDGGNSPPSTGIWHRPASTGVLSAVAVSGGVAPGAGGQTYRFVSGVIPSPSINDAGQIAFHFGLSTSGSRGVFFGTPGDVTAIVLTGSAAPGAVVGGSAFSEFGLPKLT
jgi:hypothetical protein